MKLQKVLITGANSGIGKAVAHGMANLGYHVIMVCRNEKRGQEALSEVVNQSGNHNVELMLCDLSSMASIQAFYQTFIEKHDSLNILINNAGVASSKRHETVDGFEMQFAVNYLGMYALTGLLLPQLKKGAPARIINVSSMAYKSGKIHFDDLQLKNSYKSINAYGQSKLAVVLFTRLLSEKIGSEDITVNCLNPGLSGTQMGVSRDDGSGKFLASVVKLLFQSPEKGAETTLFLATSDEVAHITGQYFSKKKMEPLTPRALDDEAAKKLWTISARLSGVEPNSKSESVV